LGGPVEGEANVHSKVFVGVVRWQVGGITLSHRNGVVELRFEGVVVAGVGGVAAMEDGSNHAFTVVNGDPCPLTEQMHLGALDLEVR